MPQALLELRTGKNAVGQQVKPLPSSVNDLLGGQTVVGNVGIPISIRRHLRVDDEQQHAGEPCDWHVGPAGRWDTGLQSNAEEMTTEWGSAPEKELAHLRVIQSHWE